MAFIRRSTGIALLTACLGVLAAQSLRADAQSAPMEVTTDTPAYCQQLSDQVGQRVRASKSAPPEVVRLTDEGDRLCDEGKVRGGIQRLRRAWLLMTHPDQLQGER